MKIPAIRTVPDVFGSSNIGLVPMFWEKRLPGLDRLNPYKPDDPLYEKTREEQKEKLRKDADSSH